MLIDIKSYLLQHEHFIMQIDLNVYYIHDL